MEQIDKAIDEVRANVSALERSAGELNKAMNDFNDKHSEGQRIRKEPVVAAALDVGAAICAYYTAIEDMKVQS